MTSLTEQFAELIERAQQSSEYWQDIALNDFTRELHARIQKLGITQAELAERLGTSRPYVTKQLSGGNFTLATMVKFAMALDAVVRIKLEDKNTATAIEASTGVVVDLATRRAMGRPLSKVTTEGTGTSTVMAAWRS